MTPSQTICCVLALVCIFLGGAVAQRHSTKTTPTGIMGFVLFLFSSSFRIASIWWVLKKKEGRRRNSQHLGPENVHLLYTHFRDQSRNLHLESEQPSVCGCCLFTVMGHCSFVWCVCGKRQKKGSTSATGLLLLRLLW